MKRLTIFALLALCACSHPSSDPFIDAVHSMRPSVVLLTMQVPSADRRSWDTEYATGTVISSGEWGSDILTVQHAVDQARNVRVTIANKLKVPGTLVAADPKLDVAIVTTKAKLPAAKLGDSTAVLPGESIGLMGYPIPDIFEEDGLGLATSINSGRISAVRAHAIELNLPIVPGESGGPVFASDGAAVVGVAESRFDEERSIGFALPINEAKPFLHKHSHY
ncbi:MAG: serine protease [Candidatus Eremiobacteraeota bacterium]|nr:serine protease [Candidatus Eremiobacteraeota bacterium]MBV9737477.1 serine protease [Candidatus Eremiobacteraeota bacterium]